MQYKVSIKLTVEADTEAEAENKFLDRITDGEYEINNNLEIEPD